MRVNKEYVMIDGDDGVMLVEMKSMLGMAA